MHDDRLETRCAAPAAPKDVHADDFDRWLRRALLTRLAPLAQAPLPPAIAALAAELEMKLRRARRQ